MKYEGPLAKVPNWMLRNLRRQEEILSSMKLLRRQEEILSSMKLLRLFEGLEIHGEPHRERGPQDRTILNAAKVILLREHRELMSQRTACGLIGIARSTYRKYEDDPEVKALAEQLKRDPHVREELDL